MGPQQASEGAEEALRLYARIEQAVFEKGYDALITPTVATSRIAAGYDPTKDIPVIDGRRVDPYAGWFLTSVFSLINWMPVMTVPAGIYGNDVPCGMQIAGRPYDDETVAALTAVFGRSADPTPFDRIPR